jgi:hypothetical protein
MGGSAASQYRPFVRLRGGRGGVWIIWCSDISGMKAGLYQLDLILQQWYAKGDAGKFLEEFGEQMDMASRSSLVGIFAINFQFLMSL